MVEKTIRIIAESPDVLEFLAEADTLEEMRKIAPEVMEMILKMDAQDKLQKKNEQPFIAKSCLGSFLQYGIRMRTSLIPTGLMHVDFPPKG